MYDVAGCAAGHEVWVTVMYKGGELGKQRLDMVVDDCIVIEIKSTHELQKKLDSPTLQLPARNEPDGWYAPPFRSRAKVLSSLIT